MAEKKKQNAAAQQPQQNAEAQEAQQKENLNLTGLSLEQGEEALLKEGYFKADDGVYMRRISAESGLTFNGGSELAKGQEIRPEGKWSLPKDDFLEVARWKQGMWVPDKRPCGFYFQCKDGLKLHRGQIQDCHLSGNPHAAFSVLTKVYPKGFRIKEANKGPEPEKGKRQSWDYTIEPL